MPPIVCHPAARRNTGSKVFCFQKNGDAKIALLVRKNPTKIPYYSAKIRRISEVPRFLFRIRITALRFSDHAEKNARLTGRAFRRGRGWERS